MDTNTIGGTWGNSFWSGADVEVSLANPRFVYAGGVMSNTADIFVSKDWGATFDPVTRFANMGTITVYILILQRIQQLTYYLVWQEKPKLSRQKI